MMLGFLSPRGAVAAGRAWARGLLLVGFGLLCLAIEPAQAAQFVDAAPLPAPRSSLAAVLMPSGKVFAIGGAAGTSRATTQMYDPAANVWTPAASMVFARNALTATVLPNGKVLAAAGFGAGALKSAELYDPAAGTWTRTGDLATARSLHTATLLPSGKVLVAGGYDLGHVSSAELYDPATNAWSSAGTLNIARDWHTAALLPSGKVLIAGGFGTGGSGSVPLSSAEIYDPATNTWTLASPMSIARAVFTATPLPSGKVLVTGGDTNPLTAASAEVFDPASGTWTPVSSMSHMRAYHSATLLPSGHVLVAAGINLGTWVLDAEIYDPVSNVWHAAGTMSTPRQFHAAVGLPSGKVLFVGGNNAGGAIASVELYDPTTTTSITSVVPDVTEVGAESVVSFEVNAEFGTPTGSVVVTDDAGASCGPVVLVAGSGSCTLVATSPGGHSIAAVYTPDDDAFATSTGFSGYVVLAATTTIEIISDTPDPSELFQPYDVSVHVSALRPAAGIPTGNVMVGTSDDPFLCFIFLDDAGDGTCAIFAESAGSIELIASYEGNSDFEPAQSAPETHTVQRVPTTTILMDENFFNSVATEPVQFSVFVDTGGSNGQPTGTVVIGDAGESCTATLAGNIASCTIAFAHAGNHAISATYGGDEQFYASTSDVLTHWVWQAQTGVSIVAHDPDPSTPMQPVTVTAAVSVQAPGAGVPPGPILVTGSFGEQCTIVQSGESCQLALVFRGAREITAQFVGDDDFGASTNTVQHRVNALPHVFGETYASNEDETLSVALERGLLINDLDEDGDHLTVVNTGPQTATGIGGTVTLNADGSFSYAPPPNAFGDASFEYVVSDGYETVSASTTLTVNPVNDPPSFTLAASPKWPANTSGAQFTIAFATPTDFGPGESNYVLAWHVRIIDDPNGVLSGKVTIGGDDNLYYTLSGHGGVATLGVTLQDDGGTANGGNDTSPEQMFTITVGFGADLSVAIDDGTDFAVGGDPLLYVITVRNLGPDRVDGARVLETMLSNLVDPSWVCTPSAGASCAASGTGSIEDYVNLPSGATLVYELTATVLAIPEQPAYNYISLSPPAGVTDFNPANDEAVDIDITGIFADGFDVTGDSVDGEEEATATRRR